MVHFIGLMKCWNARSSFYFITFLWLDAITGVTLAAERPLCTGKSGVNFMHGPLEFRRYSGQGGSRSLLKFVNESSTHVLELCLFDQSFAAKHQHRIDSPFEWWRFNNWDSAACSNCGTRAAIGHAFGQLHCTLQTIRCRLRVNVWACERVSVWTCERVNV